MQKNSTTFGSMRSSRNYLEFYPEWGSNKESLTDLWMGLLQFHANEFRFEDFVIDISQKMLITRERNEAVSQCDFAIQDPFEIKRNLGEVPSKSSEIKRTILCGLEKFTTSVVQVSLKVTYRSRLLLSWSPLDPLRNL